MARKSKHKWLSGYAYAWVTLGFLLISLVGHWTFGWLAYVGEQLAHKQPVQVTEYIVQMSRDTLENWQSEFLQLLWQVGGLALLLYVGLHNQGKATIARKQSSMRF